MDELITRIAERVGIDEATARNAVHIILSFLYEEGARDEVVKLIERIPGAAELVDSGDATASETLGGFGGLMGGGAMAVLGKLQGAGLGMGEIQGVTKELVAFAREKAGDDIVDAVLASIPGLSQFA